MPGMGSKFGFTLLCGVFCLPASGAFATQRRAEHKHAVKQEQEAAAPQPPPPPGPLVPLSLAQVPANPPQVSYNNGQLTIVARNSTLGDILRAVHAQTGAAIDIAGNASERVVSTFGPGPAREVLADLLNGSHFNYVMTGSAANANAVERVILTPKTAPEPQTAAQNQPNPAQVSRTRDVVSRPNTQQTSDDDAEDASESDMTPNDQASPPSNSADSNDQQPNNGQPPIKTPEQLLQELQRQQQVQQVQQPGVPPGGAATPQPGPPQK
jgi:hypothetical protein